MRKTTRRLIIALALVAVSLLAVEAALALLDPLGGYRYFNDLRIFQARYLPHAARYYVPAPGLWQMSNWTYQIDLPDYTRHTPASKPDADCTVVALGDSVTFGLGVNDDETWPNYYAEMTGCGVINTAMPGYDIWAVEAAYKAFPDADRYLYLLISNDADHDAAAQVRLQGRESAINMYLYLALSGDEGQRPPIPDEFWKVYDALVSDERVEIYGFQTAVLAEQVAATGRAIRLIPPYTTRISWADAHPDAGAQRTVAGAIMEAGDGTQ